MQKLIFVLVVCCTTSSIPAQNLADTIPNLANMTSEAYLKNLPLTMVVKYFKNKHSSRYHPSVQFIYNTEMKFSCKEDTFSLDTSHFKEEDKVRFILYFKSYTIETNLFPANSLKSGGEIICGLIKDYPKFKNDFDKHEADYRDNTAKNRIYDVMKRIERANTKTAAEKKSVLVYAVIRSRLDNLIGYTWKFENPK